VGEGMAGRDRGKPASSQVHQDGGGRGPLSAIDRKLVQAAARTHARTGLTIASHTGDTRAALDQMDVLAEERIRPEAFIWVHAQSDWEPESRVEAAGKARGSRSTTSARRTSRNASSGCIALKQRAV